MRSERGRSRPGAVGAIWRTRSARFGLVSGREEGRIDYVPVRVGGGNGALVLWIMYEVSGLEVVLCVVLAGGFAEKCVVIETSALTERCAGERHAALTLWPRCVVAARRGGWSRTSRAQYQPCCLVFVLILLQILNVRYYPHCVYCPHCVQSAQSTRNTPTLTKK